MNYERQKLLLERLLDRTRAGDIAWQEGARSGSFQVSFPNNSVQITLIGAPKGPDYRISIVDSSGRTTETFTEEQLDRDGPHKSGSWYTVMQELFLAARRKALKADETIDEILSVIG